MTARELRGNELFPLDTPATMQIVQKGLVGVFATVMRDGVPVGRRRFLFAVPAGEALFGIPAAENAARPSLVAVALENSTLGPARGLPRSGELGEAETRVAVEWVARWREVLDLAESPEAAAPLSTGALEEFHAEIPGRVERLLLDEDREDKSRLEARQAQSRALTSGAVETLASVLMPDRQAQPEGEDVFVAAAAVGRHQGIELKAPPAHLSLPVTEDPVEAIARASHVRVRRILLHDRWWQEDCGPLLAFRGPERVPVALLPVRPGSYRMFDPVRRVHTAVDAGLAATLDPQAFMIYRPLPEKATEGLGLLKFALRGHGKDLAVILGTSILATLLGMFTPQAMAVLVDHAIPDGNRDVLVHIGLGLAAAAFGAAVFRFAQGIAMMRIETSAELATQSAVWDRLLNLQLSFFRRFSTGDLQSRVSAVSQIRAYLGGTTLRTLFSSVILLLNLGLLLYYSVLLTGVAVVVAALSGAITIVSSVLILRRARALLELRGRFFGLMVQLMNGVAKLRVAAAEDRAFARWAHDYARVLKLELSQRRIEDGVQVLNLAVSTLSTIALFAMAAALMSGGEGLTTGAFLAFNVAYGTFIGAVVGLSNTVTSVMAIAILRERARPILEAVPEVTERKSHPGTLGGRLEMVNIVFSYIEDGPVILDGLSLRVEPRQFVALVGPSGGGKSTIFRLMLGFETPTSGGIFYDGQDLSGLDVYAIRRQMGVVLQNGKISAGSLFENIVTGSELSLNEAWEAAHAVGFDADIKAMPMGMHTVVNEGGSNLSGGQRQRLLLTRALIHKPAMLLLDEATSALDNQTQAIVSESLEGLQVTRLVIAHRLSTVQRADRIYVIEGGRIAQAGAFDELAAQEGLFARLMARQMT